jgi:hypothetical protein
LFDFIRIIAVVSAWGEGNAIAGFAKNFICHLNYQIIGIRPAQTPCFIVDDRFSIDFSGQAEILPQPAAVSVLA